jgi:hypothetical protein
LIGDIRRFEKEGLLGKPDHFDSVFVVQHEPCGGLGTLVIPELQGGIMGELLTPMHLMMVAIVAFVLFAGRSFPSLAKDWAKVYLGSKME